MKLLKIRLQRLYLRFLLQKRLPEKKRKLARPIAAAGILAMIGMGWYNYPRYFGESIDLHITRGQTLIAQKRYSDAESEFRKGA